MPSITKQTDLAKIPFVRYLDTNGDGTGTKEAIGNYSVTPDTFFIQPATNEIMNIGSLLLHVAGGTAFGISEYGNIGTPLTVGVVINITINGSTIAFTNSHPLKSNGDLMHIANSFDIHAFKNLETSIAARITNEAFGTGLILKGYTNDKLEIILNDDFTTLTSHDFIVTGFK